MKKNIIKIGLLFSAIAVSSLLTGCGSSSPEDVVTEYIEEVYEGDIEGVIKLSGKDSLKRAERMKKRCSRKLLASAHSESIVFAKSIYKKPEVIAEIKKFTEKMEKDTKTKEKVENLMKLKDKEGVRKILIEVALKETGDLLKLVSKENVKSQFGKNTNNVENIEKMVTYTLVLSGNNARGFGRTIEMISPEVFKDIKPSVECLKHEYHIKGDISKINVLEVKSESPDISTVRIEVIDSKEKSNKGKFTVEKLNDIWKVVGERRE